MLKAFVFMIYVFRTYFHSVPAVRGSKAFRISRMICSNFHWISWWPWEFVLLTLGKSDSLKRSVQFHLRREKLSIAQSGITAKNRVGTNLRCRSSHRSSFGKEDKSFSATSHLRPSHICSRVPICYTSTQLFFLSKPIHKLADQDVYYTWQIDFCFMKV